MIATNLDALSLSLFVHLSLQLNEHLFPALVKPARFIVGHLSQTKCWSRGFAEFLDLK